MKQEEATIQSEIKQSKEKKCMLIYTHDAQRCWKKLGGKLFGGHTYQIYLAYTILLEITNLLHQ